MPLVRRDYTFRMLFFVCWEWLGDQCLAAGYDRAWDLLAGWEGLRRHSESRICFLDSTVKFFTRLDVFHVCRPLTGTWSSVHYKGDWLQRPITSNEIPLLARALVWLSLRLNHALGLDVTWKGEEAEEPAENVLQELQRWMRKRGHR
jgi:hypothetical protein